MFRKGGTLPEDARAVLDCLLYVELNPVRGGLVERPEEWRGSSVYLRDIRKDEWLVPLEELLCRPDKERAMVEFRQLLYHRGAVPTKEGQAAIPEEVLEQEAARGFKTSGLYRKRLGYFVDGLAVGTEEFIRGQLAMMREDGRYDFFIEDPIEVNVTDDAEADIRACVAQCLALVEVKVREYPEQWFAFRPTWGIDSTDRLRQRRRRSLRWRRRSDALSREAVVQSHKLRERDGEGRRGRDS